MKGNKEGRKEDRRTGGRKGGRKDGRIRWNDGDGSGADGAALGTA